MTNRELRPLGQWLASGELAGLVAAARDRSALTQAVRALLPPEEARELVAAAWADDGALVLSVTSGAWAARLRYRQSQFDAERIRIRVSPPTV